MLKMPSMPKSPPKYKQMLPWFLGVFPAAALAIGLIFPTIPFLGTFLAPVITSLAGAGAIGLGLGFLGLFLLPKLISLIPKLGEGVRGAAKIVKAFLMASIMAGISFAIGYFLAPILIGLLAKVAFFHFLSGGAGHSIAGLILLGISTVFAFFSSLWKSAAKPMVANNLGRAAEMGVGFLVTALGIISLVPGAILGVMHLGVLAALPGVGFAILAVGALAVFGLFSSTGKFVISKKLNTERTEMDDLEKLSGSAAGSQLGNPFSPPPPSPSVNSDPNLSFDSPFSPPVSANAPSGVPSVFANAADAQAASVDADPDPFRAAGAGTSFPPLRPPPTA